MSTGLNKINLFGIRHLSPGGAYHLRAFLDEIKPTAVLIEGPIDANSQIEYMTAKGTKPPIAILAYTEELPIRTILYPFANYSPEYQALLWAKENGAYAQFIDLPTNVTLALERPDNKANDENSDNIENDSRNDDGNIVESNDENNAGNPPQTAIENSNKVQASQNKAETINGQDEQINITEKQTMKEKEASKASGYDRDSIYDKWAKLAGEEDYENYWERNFELNLNKDTYRQTTYEYSRSIRELSEDNEQLKDSFEYARNLIREAYMRYNIEKIIKEGHKPEKIVVVTGAYHSSVLKENFAAMTEDEFKKLPKRKTSLTLMPYSYYKLSSQSGYGAGNSAPAYYGYMWKFMKSNEMNKLPAYYLSKIASLLRKSGTHRSSAEVIEGVRLANSLAAINYGSAPTLKDLRDAASVCLGQGNLSVIAEAVAKVEVGTDIGLLPEGVSKTPIQDDFYRELKRLKLEKYRTAVAEELDLDLRENRRVKSEEAAYLDLNRSSFLHRLRELGISFAKYVELNNDGATWAEKWIIRWTPEAEIELVESTLRGETVELATAYEFKERLDKCQKISEASKVIAAACRCGMLEYMEIARITLQRLAVDTGDFIEIADTARDLSVIISYGDIRKYDSSLFIPIMQQLFLRGTLLLLDSCSCNDEAAIKMLPAINAMQLVAAEHYKEVDENLWFEKLKELSDRDDKNPKLSGYATAILLEKNMITNENLSAEVSRRLSPGIAADLGAGWFEGLSMRNKYALLSRMTLWEQLAAYVASLDKEEFKRALVFLRRAFGNFEGSEKNKIAEILGEVWNINTEATSEYLNETLNEEEKEAIDNLNDFDFGDI